ncbi:hypothetical protein, partial [Salmonella sp. SAL4355]|uniref:hypothetical protein n=1 Tax=Salmonella sp. SAL4355 TaxID=3159876 RepID=UPI0039799D0F
PDTDSDTVCNLSDNDDDNDGRSDPNDPDDANPHACGDFDDETCDDCTVGADGFGPQGDAFTANDGPDTDSDGACNA